MWPLKEWKKERKIIKTLFCKKSHIIHKVPLNSVNVGVWNVMGTTRTIWLIWFSVTKTSQWWITYILQTPVCSVLNYTSRTETCNQQCVCYVRHSSVMWWKRYSVPLIWQVKILTATHWTKMCRPQYNSKLEYRQSLHYLPS